MTRQGQIGTDYLVFGLGARVNFFGTEGATDHAFPMYTQVAQRVTDRGGLEESGCELVEQWLERVVVVAVDEDDVDVGVLERLGRADAGEASAEDEHARTR